MGGGNLYKLHAKFVCGTEFNRHIANGRWSFVQAICKVCVCLLYRV